MKRAKPRTTDPRCANFGRERIGSKKSGKQRTMYTKRCNLPSTVIVLPIIFPYTATQVSLSEYRVVSSAGYYLPF